MTAGLPVMHIMEDNLHLPLDVSGEPGECCGFTTKFQEQLATSEVHALMAFCLVLSKCSSKFRGWMATTEVHASMAFCLMFSKRSSSRVSKDFGHRPLQ